MLLYLEYFVSLGLCEYHPKVRKHCVFPLAQTY